MRTALNCLSLLMGGLLFASSALSQASGFGISVTVVDHQAQHRQTELLASVPVPAAAQALDSNGHAYTYPDNVTQSAAFFGSELSRHGYRLVSRSGDGQTARETWQGEEARVVLHMQQALGSVPATRIRILASASATQG